MSLLLRRRAMMQLAEDGVEGGGPNDGKNIVVLHKIGHNTNWRQVSNDFGVSFKLVNAPKIAYTASADLASNGWIFFSSTSYGRLVLGDTVDYTYASPASFVRTGSNSTGTNGTIAYAKASQISSDSSQILVLYGTSHANATGIKLFDLLNRTGSVVSSSANIPSFMSSIGTTGPLFEANRDTLQHVIIGKHASQRYGIAFEKGSISHDWGATWSNIADCLEGADVSHSVDDDTTARLSSVAWSADGKYCAIVYDYKLYFSNNYGYYFRSMSCGDITPRSVVGSQKLKTMFVVATGSGNIYRTLDRGRSWIKVKHIGSQAAGATSYIALNDAGDKVWTFVRSGSENAPAYYSHDYGNTWTGSKSGSNQYYVIGADNGSWRFFGSSRDHRVL